MHLQVSPHPRRAPSVWLASTFLVITFGFAACDRAASPIAPSIPAAPTPSFVLTGTIADKDGPAPLPGASVKVVDGVNSGKTAVADATGHYSLGNLESGTFSVQAGADGFESISQSLSVTANQVVDFSLTRMAGDPAPEPAPTPVPRWSLAGAVLDANTNAPLGGVRVEVDGGPNRGRATTTDTQGRYRVTDLETGSASIEASLPGYVSATRLITLDADRTLDLVLQPDATTEASGRIVDAISDRPLAGVTLRIDGLGETTSGGDGSFSLVGTGVGKLRAVLASSGTTVERQTRIRFAGEEATLTLIPTSLNLRAFDEMFRARGGLHRWVRAPQLIVQRRVLQFTDTFDASYVGTSDLMSNAEVTNLVADLTWALQQLTDGRYGSFAGVQIEAAAEAAAVSVVRPGAIVVARYEGLTTATSYWGYSRWAWNGGGETEAGVMMLDQDFEMSGSEFLRSLHAHELGHTLGYDHVTVGASVMNASARVEPTPFDLDGVKIAFRRPTLNRTPDIDPDPVVVSRMSKALSWAGSH